MTTIKIIIKPTATGDKIELDIDPTILVSDLKVEIAKSSPIPAAEQRVIYRGQILKDERTVESYGIANEHVVHLVKGKSTAASAGDNSAGAAAGATPAVPGAANTAANAGPMGMLGNPQMISEMMNSPMMQHLLNDPEMLRNIFTSNPAIREMMDRNPELGQMLNNPAMLRQMMEAARNPSLLQEQMRQADRQLHNIEAMPEGFNRLRQMYESVQEPMMNAAMSGGAAGNAANPLAALFGGAGNAGATNATTTSVTDGDGTEAQPNAAPLPNPWAGPGSEGGAGGGATGGARTDVPAGLGGSGLAGLMQGQRPNPEQIGQMMQNPMVQNMMRSMFNNPQVMQQMMEMDPNMRNMMQSNPQMREMMTGMFSNPQFMEQMLNPGNVQAIMQLQQSGLMGAMGGPSPMAGAGGPTAGSPPGATAMPNMNMLAQLMGGGGGMPFAPPPAADPETAFANQLQQLQDMGFYDRQANITALQATGGNVNAAVERLLSS